MKKFLVNYTSEGTILVRKAKDFQLVMTLTSTDADKLAELLTEASRIVRRRKKREQE